jgi:hypothetical protein
MLKTADNDQKVEERQILVQNFQREREKRREKERGQRNKKRRREREIEKERERHTADTFILDFYSQNNEKINFCCFKPPDCNNYDNFRGYDTTFLFSPHVYYLFVCLVFKSLLPSYLRSLFPSVEILLQAVLWSCYQTVQCIYFRCQVD